MFSYLTESIGNLFSVLNQLGIFKFGIVLTGLSLVLYINYRIDGVVWRFFVNIPSAYNRYRSSSNNVGVSSISPVNTTAEPTLTNQQPSLTLSESSSLVNANSQLSSESNTNANTQVNDLNTLCVNFLKRMLQILEFLSKKITYQIKKQ